MDDLDESDLKMERCILDDEEVSLPEILAENSEVFSEVMNMDTWQKVLTEHERQHLLDFLPQFPQSQHQNTQETLRMLFSGQNFKFGNPLIQFRDNLRGGYYTPDILKYRELCKKARYKEYQHSQRGYYMALLKELLVNREKILEKAKRTPIDQSLILDHVYHKEKPKENCVDTRAKKKYYRILKEVCDEVGEENSSDDEEAANTAAYSRAKQNQRFTFPEVASEAIQTTVQATFDPRPVTSGEGTGKVLRHTAPLELTEDDYLEMLRRHRKRRVELEDDPDLDVKHVTLQDIVQRVQPTKKGLKAFGLSKKKMKMEKKRLKLQIPPGEGSLEKFGEQAIDEDDDGLDNIDVQSFEAGTSGLTAEPRSYGQHASFFSLLRDFICEYPEMRFTTVKLEEQVRQWQESGCSKLNQWFNWQSNWMELVASALKFLAGDVLGRPLDLPLEDFVPYLDYKERAQQWRWIGQGRDSDIELTPLCSHWLEHKDQMLMDKYDSNQSSPPPPRIKTAYVVRPTTEEEKRIFREQEQRRFDNPHRAFVYVMHGYESVVGPVKGVYNKEGAINKAREHPLLVNERYAYVTVLTLVRDAAARLPNGEGTRADICELLKDSQYIAPGVTDAQINNVVSGALDRLHYEKDPCVKYDVNKKTWIYLHRNRTKAEFERIHQAQGAAAKAKKALQKPKSTKGRAKETVTTSSALTSAAVASIINPAAASVEPSTKSNTKSRSAAPAPQLPTTPVTKKGTALTQQTVSMLMGQSQAKASTKVKGSPPGAAKAAPVSPHVDPVKTSTVVFLQPQLVRPAMAPHGQLTGKPLSVSLIQSLTSAGILQAKAGTATAEGVQSVMIDSATLKTLTSTTSAQGASLLQTASGSPTVSPAASPRTAASPGTQPAPGSTPSTPTLATPSKPRTMLQMQSPQQVVSLASLGASTLTSPHPQPVQQINPLRLPQMLKPGAIKTVNQALALQRSLSMESSSSDSEGKPGTPVTLPGSPQVIGTSRSILQQISLAQAGKPGTVMLGTPQPGKTGASPNVISTHLVQSAGQITGKPVVVGGKPIVIGGKPVILAGKPVAGGKVATVQLGGKPGQLGQRGVINLVSQAAEQQVVTPATTTVTTASKQTTTLATQSIVSQILQSGTALVRGQGQTHATGQAGKPQPGKVVAPGQGSIILTQLPAGTRVRPGTPPVAQQRGTVVSQAGLLQGAQIIVQSSQAQSRVVTPQMLAAAGQRPALLTAAGARSPGVQYLKTVLTQPGSSSSQPTLVLTQAGLQTIQTATSLPGSQTIKATLATAAAKQTRAGPVYARVITPPSGVRLGGIKGQGINLNAGQGVSIVQSSGKGDEVVEVVDDSPDTEGSNH